MIVGNGLVAKSINSIDHNSILFFASGVSNSLETNQEKFDREKELVKDQLKKNTEKLFVYFSTCSIYDKSVSQRPYIQHKLQIENLIQTSGNKFLIFRLSNLVGRGGNPNTLMNFLFNSVKNGSQFEIWENATRNFLGTEDMIVLIDTIIQGGSFNHIYDIAFPQSYSIIQVVQQIEDFLGKNANFVMKNNIGEPVNIDTKPIETFFTQEFQTLINSENYLNHLLTKYYS